MANPYNDDGDAESQALLTGEKAPEIERPTSVVTSKRFGYGHIAAVFVAGVASAVLVQTAYSGLGCRSLFSHRNPSAHREERPYGPSALFAAPWAGSTEVHPFPPTSPTNTFPDLFPTDVGLAGPTPTGAEPALVVTAPVMPVHTNAPNLIPPIRKPGGSKKGKDGWDLFKHWGNLSPWYSVPRGTFGLDSGPEAPAGCAVTGLHFLHRHGARYPTQWASFGGPADFATRLNKAASKWNASGDLDFMNEWTYKLGEEILTPFGRQQLYDLGVSLRMKYGFLLNNFTETNTIPVFRTESQDRMLASAMNFAIGFFGYPFEGQYQQSITLEAPHGTKQKYNNTLAPYQTCEKAGSKYDRGTYFVVKWAEIYLAAARARLAPLIQGYDLKTVDLYAMQQTCAYETVAIGYSKFCELFTEEEWEGFDYALDLYFWYGSAFGSPTARVQGLGYVQELVARLTHTPIETHNSTTNATLNDDPRTFPLGQALYVDATHEVVVLNVLTALNLTTLAAGGPLPADHIPANRSFVVSQLAPFATNVQFQLLSCASTPDPQIRIIVNDGVVPLTGIEDCPTQADGMCAVNTFVAGQKRTIRETDWAWGCQGDWTVLPGEQWNTTTGDPPAKQ